MLEIHDDPAWQFLIPYLGTQEEDSRSNDEAQSSMIRMKSSPPTLKGIHAAAHILFRYRLLDIMADVQNIHPHPTLESVPKVALTTNYTTVHLDRV